MKKIFHISGYLTHSFWMTIRREGLFVSLKRLCFFVVYGKGVTSKKDLEQHKKRMQRKPLPLGDALNLLKDDAQTISFLEESIDIIIPVFNGFDYVKALFKSLEKGTTAPCRYIVIDDASTDKNIWTWLQDWKLKHPNWDMILLRNVKNRGFVGTVNKGVSHSRGNFVILNTDTEVPLGWLERLMYPIIYGEKVASVTPFTNSGTIFSFPKTLQDNDLLGDLSVQGIDAVFQKMHLGDIEVPTGMGFCMAFNRKVVEKMGMFDEKAFGKGYGEENDWCLRAKKKGYRNVVATNLFVYHKHGVSFLGTEKKHLLEKNIQKLNQKHPGYDCLVQDFIGRDPLRIYREISLIGVGSMATGSEGQELIIDHELGGGANLYTEEYVQGRALQGKGTFIFSFDFGKKEYHLRYRWNEYEVLFVLDDMTLLEEIVERYNISSIRVNQLVSFPHPLGMLQYILHLRKKKKLTVIHLLHDYFALCPSYTLLNEQQFYCYVPKDLRVCEQCLLLNKGTFRTFVSDKDIQLWRKEWGHFLQNVDEIVCFSFASRDIVLRAYPKLHRVIVKPHIVDYLEEKKLQIRKKSKKDPLVIGILGGINKDKGSEIIKKMVQIVDKEKKNIKIVVIGPLVENIKGNCLLVHGKFKRDEIPLLTKRYEVDVFFIPSIWPETFSYTAEEVMQMNFPLAVFDLGAPAERAKKYKKGIIIKDINAQKVLDLIARYVGK